ncbi:MAG: hypothetical protein NAOJABEB_03332 [Steroidobacteraceae bacterium]|nr:hypothetical protein [Steroidobacteraceae bacterium]
MSDISAVSIGGMTALSIQMVVMSQIRRLTRAGHRMDRLFDILNWPIAFSLVAVANPPWPLYSWPEWQAYTGLSLALATLASVTAKKAGDAKPRTDGGTE